MIDFEHSQEGIYMKIEQVLTKGEGLQDVVIL